MIIDHFKAGAPFHNGPPWARQWWFGIEILGKFTEPAKFVVTTDENVYAPPAEVLTRLPKIIAS